MLNRLEPEIGKWYRNESGAIFEVVAFDEEEGIVEIQHFDGAVEELDLDGWFGQLLKANAEPEDWSGPFDDLSVDDFGDTDVVRYRTDHANPLDLEESANPLDGLDWED